MKYKVTIYPKLVDIYEQLENVIGMCFIDDDIVIYTDDRCVRKYKMEDINKIITDVIEDDTYSTDERQKWGVLA